MPDPVQPLLGMFLARVHCENFRSCQNTHIEFQPDLTVLVGENNSGKSNIIDAIRLATTPANGRRTRYFEEGDRTHTASHSKVQIWTEFAGLSEAQFGLYYTALDTASSTCLYSTVVDMSKVDVGRLPRPSQLSGPISGPDVEPEAREKIRHVYLAPLRDAQRELDSPDASRLLSIIELLVSKDHQEEFVRMANENLEGLQEHPAVREPAARIGHHIGRLTDPVRRQNVEAQFTGMRLRQLVRSLRIKMAEAGLALADLSESGLGYANLLYIATVLLELQNARDAELTLFLVEEPEAHLHPQLQSVLLDYLLEQARNSLRDDVNSPAGRVQVICTTHSPNLSSSVPVEKVVIVRSNVSDSEDRGTKTIPIAGLPLQDKHNAKITRFLDTTKASLLFARRIILVEGLAEALLLPSIARRVLGPDGSLFAGVTVIAVGGTDFEPYVRLLLTKHRGASLVDRLVVITDKDPNPLGEELVDRVGWLARIGEDIDASERLHVFASDRTLEADLIDPAENRPALKSAYLDQHPRSEAKWDAVEAAASPSAELHAVLQRDAKFISKGEFAQSLARLLDEDCDFLPPGYLDGAIRRSLATDEDEDIEADQAVEPGEPAE